MHFTPNTIILAAFAAVFSIVKANPLPQSGQQFCVPEGTLCGFEGENELECCAGLVCANAATFEGQSVFSVSLSTKPHLSKFIH